MASATLYNICTFIKDKTKIGSWKDVIEKERKQRALNEEESSFNGLMC